MSERVLSNLSIMALMVIMSTKQKIPKAISPQFLYETLIGSLRKSLRLVLTAVKRKSMRNALVPGRRPRKFPRQNLTETIAEPVLPQAPQAQNTWCMRQLVYIKNCMGKSPIVKEIV